MSHRLYPRLNRGLHRLFLITAKRSVVPIIIGVYCLLSTVYLFADIIYLKNGGSIEGQITQDDGETITLEVLYGKVFIEHKDIETIIRADYFPELPLEEIPEEPLTPSEPKPVTPTLTTPVETARTGFQISDENKTPQQKRINVLLRELTDKDSKPWQIMSELIKEDKKDIPYLLDILKQSRDDPVLSRWIIYVLGQSGAELVITPLQKRLSDKDPLIRAAAAKALGNFDTPAIREVFKLRLKDDTDPAVRFNIIHAMARWQDISITPLLIDLLNDKSRQVRSAASDALVKFHRNLAQAESPEPASPAGRWDIVDMLITKISVAEPTMRKEILSLLGQIKDERSRTALMDLLVDEDKEIRSLAAMALAGIADKDTIRFLKERLMEEKDVWTRIQIILVFQKSKDYDTIPILIETLKDPEENIRFAASRALRTITKRSFGANYERWQKWWDTLQGKR